MLKRFYFLLLFIFFSFVGLAVLEYFRYQYALGRQNYIVSDDLKSFILCGLSCIASFVVGILDVFLPLCFPQKISKWSIPFVLLGMAVASGIFCLLLK